MSMQIIEKFGRWPEPGLWRYGAGQRAGREARRAHRRDRAELNLKGFRPGKVPPAHVRRLYGKALMGEVIEETLNETSQKVLDDNEPARRRPAGPEARIRHGQGDRRRGRPAYEMTVEVMPDFEPMDVPS